MTKSKQVVIDYTPRAWQKEASQSLTRFTTMVIHRRAGKTVFAVNELVKRALFTQKNRPQVAYIAPTYGQAKKVAWDYLKAFVSTIPETTINESELRIDFGINGGRIMLLGAENPDSLRGLYLDYAVLDEVADMPANLWTQVVRPALSDRKGGALFIGTPKGKNFFHTLYMDGQGGKPGWSSKLLTYKDTNALDPAEMEDLIVEYQDRVEEFQQEYECSFTAAIKGAYYGKQIEVAEREKRISQVPYDSNYPVVTAWDIGFDGTAVWFAQLIGDSIHIVDYIGVEDIDTPQVASMVLAKDYMYQCHIMPHDVNKRNPATGKTLLSRLTGLGLRCRVAAKLPIKDGIHSVRSILSKCYFDRKRCEPGLESLRHYRAQFDEVKGVQQQTPVHDKYSHGADAFRYLAVGLKRSDALSSSNPRRQQHKQSNITVDNNWDPLA